MQGATISIRVGVGDMVPSGERWSISCFSRQSSAAMFFRPKMTRVGLTSPPIAPSRPKRSHHAAHLAFALFTASENSGCALIHSFKVERATSISAANELSDAPSAMCLTTASQNSGEYFDGLPIRFFFSSLLTYKVSMASKHYYH